MEATLMRPYLSFSLVFLLACLGGNNDTDDTDEIVDDVIPQSQVCADYLECAASADADAFPDLAATYGPGTACWSEGQTFADTCTDACQAGVEALAERYPDEAGCEDYAPEGCPLDEGLWYLDLFNDGYDGCELDVGAVFEWAGEVSCPRPERREFTWEISAVGFTDRVDLYCEFTNDRFTCFGREDEYDLTVTGRGSGSQATATGDWLLDWSGLCSSDGSMEAFLD